MRAHFLRIGNQVGFWGTRQVRTGLQHMPSLAMLSEAKSQQCLADTVSSGQHLQVGLFLMSATYMCPCADHAADCLLSAVAPQHL
jgi:hypothetical protein